MSKEGGPLILEFGVRSSKLEDSSKAQSRSVNNEMRKVNMSVQGIEYESFTHDPMAVVDSEKTEDQMKG